MRNGSHFSGSTPAGSRAENGNEADNEDNPVAYLPYRPESEARPDQETGQAASSSDGRLFFILLTVSITCAAASVAAGSYAVWIARRQAARQALTDVNDILRSCQSRMSQLEMDLQRLPNRPV